MPPTQHVAQARSHLISGYRTGQSREIQELRGLAALSSQWSENTVLVVHFSR